ncbi:MAG TPA: cytochrome D1 domain-containing protein [Pyrinomonadaceae bacterium]|nr:cytochrome D1 domain-containing protein [Pyrinomonadaceae bacterium]
MKSFLATALAAMLAGSVFGQPATAQSQQSGKIVREGIVIEFTIAPLRPEKTGAAGLLEGTEASVRFKIADSTTGQPVTNLRPAGWIDFREEAAVPDGRQCRERIQSFLQASLTERPDIDLNAYLILALNQEPNISVIDPLSGFGGSKLYTLIPLKSPGEDWLMSGDKQRLFVTMPLAGEIAIIDTATWKVLTNLNAGAKPTRLVLQHDEKYLWVGNDMDDEGGGVTVVDWSTTKTVARFKTGPGHHDIALADDDHYAFVTNQRAGTLSVIDVPKLALVKEIKIGSSPSGLAFSSLSKTVYGINESDGTIVAVGGPHHEVLTRIKAMPGLSALRFLPGGRYGFVLNRQLNRVHIFDSSTNRLLHNVEVGPDPDQIIFTRDVAYVRARGNEFVSLINLSSIGRPEIEISVNRFPAGQKAPQASPSTSMADAMIVTPDSGAVLVANPADQMIYYYMEGMAAPMGTFQNYRRDPRALLVWSRSLQETSPGTYTTTVKLGKQGNYDVPLLLDSPRIVHCFNFTVSVNPAYGSQRAVPIKIEPLIQERSAYAGERYQLRFKVIDTQTHQPRSDLKDLGVLTFLAPGIWQQRDLARPLGNGLYEINFVPPQAGAYYIYFNCHSLGVDFNQLPNLTIQATRRDPATATPSSPQHPAGARP